MTASYLENNVSWKYGRATSPIPVYGHGQGGAPVEISQVAKNGHLRLYQGKVGFPWSSSDPTSKLFANTPAEDGYVAIELPPSGPGEVWAGYKVVSGLELPTVEMQLADSSRLLRRGWIKLSEYEKDIASVPPNVEDGLDAAGQLIVSGDGKLLGQRGAGDFMYPVISPEDADTDAASDKGNGKTGEGTDFSEDTEPTTGSSNSTLLWALAAGAVLLGAPVLIPAGLATAALWQHSKAS